MNDLGCSFSCLKKTGLEENALAKAHLEERYALYDRQFFTCLKTRTIESRDRNETQRRKNPSNLKWMYAGYYSIDPPKSMKREAEDDQSDMRKKRAVNVAEMAYEREWRAEVEAVPQWDVNMLSVNCRA